MMSALVQFVVSSTYWQVSLTIPPLCCFQLFSPECCERSTADIEATTCRREINLWRPKRKSKLKVVESKYGTPKPAKGGKKPAPTFQKKIVVIEYMGENSPKSFGLKESYVIMRGMLPDITLTATEKEVRSHIWDVIASDKAYTCCSEYDFEFLEASGRNICVPAKPPNLTWNCKAVKSLSGTGAVYIRFTVDQEILALSSSDSEADDRTKAMKLDSKFRVH